MPPAVTVVTSTDASTLVSSESTDATTLATTMLSTSTVSTTETYFIDVDYGVVHPSAYLGYIILVFMFIFLLPLAVIMNAMRRRQMAERRLVLQRQQARRQMELNINNNNDGNNSVGSCAVGSAVGELTILPKGLDLPPSYDEVAYSSSTKQLPGNISGAESTLTIATNLESSNPNLALAINEPPPLYGSTITSSTTTVMVSSSTSVV